MSLKNLFTTTYHGEVAEGRHEATIKGFDLCINNGSAFKTSKQFAEFSKALNDAHMTKENLSETTTGALVIPLEMLPVLFTTSFEPGPKDFFRVTAIIKEDDRRITQNLFERNFAVFLKQTRIAVTGENLTDINPFDWIAGLIDKDIPLWVSYRNVARHDGSVGRFQTINWCAPLQDNAQPAATDNENNSEEPLF